MKPGDSKPSIPKHGVVFRECIGISRGVVASIIRAKAAAVGGDTRSSCGTKSSVTHWPSGIRAARIFCISFSQVGGSKWWKKRPPELHRKGIAGQQGVSVRHAELGRILAGYGQHVGPVQSRDVRLGIASGDRNAKESMSRR
jgi:hypothetical protein